ncbi:unnamed protein product, partial [Symbiodinium microadriaticum]
KARLSTLDSQPFPLVDRAATKEGVQNVIFTKAGNQAKIELQLAGHEPSAKAVEDLLTAKGVMDAKWQALRKIDDAVSEETWVEAMKEVTRAYFNYLSKEELRLQQEQSSSGLRLKRKAFAFIRSARKKARTLERNEGVNVDFSKLPLHLQKMDDGYSRLEHMCETPMPNAVLQGLRKKSADVRFLCGTMCDAAVREGSNKFLTKTLATITRE